LAGWFCAQNSRLLGPPTPIAYIAWAILEVSQQRSCRRCQVVYHHHHHHTICQVLRASMVSVLDMEIKSRRQHYGTIIIRPVIRGHSWPRFG
jgi:hypothetical protein